MSTQHGGHRRARRALAGAVSAAVAGTAAPVLAQDGPQGIEEVIVSARKRDENIQDIPQAVMAFRPEDIAKKGIRSLEDVARFAPSMTVVGASAGFNKIVFRGLADSIRPYIADSSAAIYLDEQPLTTGAQSPEIRPIDLERIETLSGPQGTLYGASSQSGTVRYIVAKPDPSAFDANIGGGMHQVIDGDQGWDTDVMVNIPVIKDKLAVRLVGFGAQDAGFIDNVAARTPYGRSKDNFAINGSDINSSDWAGGRIAAKWLVSEDWAVTGIYNNTDTTVNGFNDYDPTNGDLNTIKFVEEEWDDSWSNYQFTIDGDLGFARLSSSTSYFERDTAYTFDATSGVAYYHAVLGVYGRPYTDSDGNYVRNCAVDDGMAAYNIYDFSTACGIDGGVGNELDDGDPIGFFRNDQKDERWSHETRLTGSTSRLDWTLGFFYQKAEQKWVYGTHIPGLTQTEAWAAREVMNGGPLAPTEIYYASGEENEREDMSLFGEATWSLSEKWKLLLGARAYKAKMDRVYDQGVPFTAPHDIVEMEGEDEDGVLPKIGVQYFIDDERMVYALYSEGFRLGGVNRDRAEKRGLVPTFARQYDSDTLENWEAGFKSRWLEGSVQMNLTAYHQIWRDMQLELGDPQNGDLVDTDGDGEGDTRYPYQTVVANLADAVNDGFDLDLTWQTDFGASFGLASTYLFKHEIKDDVVVVNPNDPTDIALDIEAGTTLPLGADLKFSVYGEYTWKMDLLGGGEGYARVQYSYTDGSWNRLVDNDGCPAGSCYNYYGDRYPDHNGYGGRVRQPDYETVDLRAGYDTDLWEFSLYLDNALDQRVVAYHDLSSADVYWGRDNLRTSNPRTAGISVRRHFHAR